jgi:hypothetical protein
MLGTNRFLTFSGRESNYQTTSLTPGPSFAHNLGCRCPNDQCEAILDIYNSRPFQWHQEHPNERCFGLWCRTLNIRESRRTPNPQLWEWEFHPPTSPKVGLRQWGYCVQHAIRWSQNLQISKLEVKIKTNGFIQKCLSNHIAKRMVTKIYHVKLIYNGLIQKWCVRALKLYLQLFL